MAYRLNNKEKEERRISILKLVMAGRLEPSYRDYIFSDEWRERSKEFKEKVNNKCQLCDSTKNLHVHHKNYRNLGNETKDDIIVLCKKCHTNVHKEKTKERMEEKVCFTPKTRLTENNHNKRWTEEEEKIVLEEHKAGGRTCDIARLLGRTPSSVRTKLKQLGSPVSKSWGIE